MALLTVGENPKWRLAAILENVEWPFSATVHAIHYAFGSMVGFSGRRIECLYFQLDQIQDHGRQPSCIVFSGHISETVHPI